MQRKTLTTAQASKIYDALFPGTNYLYRLKHRMEKVGFERDDPVYVLACKAYDASLILRHEMHAQSVKSGMGRPAKD